MNKLFILSLIVFASKSYVPYQEQRAIEVEMENKGMSRQDQLEFENWVLENNKHYDNDFTLKHRMQIFFENKKEVERYNRNHFDERQQLNAFADLDKNEFRHLLFMHMEIGSDPNENPFHLFDQETKHRILNHPTLVEMRQQAQQGATLDWSQQTPPVRNQGLCGSCWAFSGADVFASRASLVSKNIPLKPVSTSYILDCMRDEKCDGCNGGLPGRAVKFLNTEGATTEEHYREYDETQKTCRTPDVLYGQNLFSSFASVDNPSVEQITEGLQTGPVSAIFYANEDVWFQYGSGVLDTCEYPKDKNTLHVAVIVGYDSVNWIVKNSWGSTWGKKGFFKVKKDFGSQKEQCNKIFRVSYALKG